MTPLEYGLLWALENLLTSARLSLEAVVLYYLACGIIAGIIHGIMSIIRLFKR